MGENSNHFRAHSRCHILKGFPVSARGSGNLFFYFLTDQCTCQSPDWLTWTLSRPATQGIRTHSTEFITIADGELLSTIEFANHIIIRYVKPSFSTLIRLFELGFLSLLSISLPGNSISLRHGKTLKRKTLIASFLSRSVFSPSLSCKP